MNIRKVLIILTSLLAAIAVIVVVINYLRTGTILVTTNEPQAEVHLITGPNQSKRVGTGNTSLRQTPGIYEVAVRFKGKESRGVTEVKARQTSSLKLDLVDLKVPTKIANYISYDIMAGNGSIRFLNKGLSEIFELPNRQLPGSSIFTDLYPVASIKWFDYRNALVELRSGELWAIINDRPTKLSLPTAYQIRGDYVPQIQAYSLNSRGQFVLQIEDKVFFYTNTASQPVEMTAVSKGMLVSLSDNGQLAVYTDALREVHESSAVKAAYIYTPDTGQEKPIPVRDDQPVTFANWVPGRNQLVYGTASYLALANLDQSNSQLLAGFKLDTASSFKIINDTSAALISDNSVWIIGLTDLVSHKLSDLPAPVIHPQALSVGAGGGELYFGTTPTQGLTGGAQLYRLQVK